MTVHDRRWRKSSRSAAQDTCVELANTFDAVRDSKNPTGPAISVDLGEFITAVKAGKLVR
jgi:hypothetical protein